MAIVPQAPGALSATDGASSPTPPLPSGVQVNDLMLTVYYSRENSGGTVSASAGWTQLVSENGSGGLLGVWWRLFQTGDAAPTFTTGGVSSGDSSLARILNYRGVDTGTPIQITGTISTNSSIQNIGPIAGITLNADGAVVVIGAKRDDWTSVATLSGDGLTWTERIEDDTTLGNDVGLVVDDAVNGASSTVVTAKTFVVTGGASQAGKGVMVGLTPAAPIELVAGLTGASTVAANLSTEIALTGVLSGSGEGAGTLTTQITVAAGLVGTGSATGTLTTAIPLIAGVSAATLTQANLDTQIALAAQVETVLQSTAALATQIALVVALIAAIAITTELNTGGTPLEGVALGTGTSLGALTTAIVLQGFTITQLQFLLGQLLFTGLPGVSNERLTLPDVLRERLVVT